MNLFPHHGAFVGLVIALLAGGLFHLWIHFRRQKHRKCERADCPMLDRRMDDSINDSDLARKALAAKIAEMPQHHVERVKARMRRDRPPEHLAAE